MPTKVKKIFLAKTFLRSYLQVNEPELNDSKMKKSHFA